MLFCCMHVIWIKISISIINDNAAAISINITLHKGQEGEGGAGGRGVLLMLEFLMKFTLSSPLCCSPLSMGLSALIAPWWE